MDQSWEMSESNNEMLDDVFSDPSMGSEKLINDDKKERPTP